MLGEANRLKWGGVVVYSGLTFSRLRISTGVLTNVAARDPAVVDLLTEAGIAVEVGDSEATTAVQPSNEIRLLRHIAVDSSARF